MEQQILNPVDVTQIAIAKKMLALESKIKSGLGMFFWVAGLSIINSVIFFTGGSISFVIGLGATQLIDALTMVFAQEVSSGTAAVLHVIGFGLDLFIAGLFTLFGVLGRKRIKWAIVVGMVFYAMDGLLSLLLKNWFGALFHFFAFIGMLHGLNATSEIIKLEKSQSTGDMVLLQKLTAASPAREPAKARKNLLIFTAVVLAPFVFLMGIFFLLAWLNLY